MKVDEIGWKWMKVDESGWNGLSGYKWMKVDENGGKTMENGCKWIKVDTKWMKMDGSGWNGMKMDEIWKWTKVSSKKWKYWDGNAV